MITSLNKGLTKGEQSDLKGQYKASVLLRKQLTLWLNDRNQMLYDEMLKDSNYDSNEWSLKHVERIAEIKANKKLIEAIK